jgi:hypothetical protein
VSLLSTARTLPIACSLLSTARTLLSTARTLLSIACSPLDDERRQARLLG